MMCIISFSFGGCGLESGCETSPGGHGKEADAPKGKGRQDLLSRTAVFVSLMNLWCSYRSLSILLPGASAIER